MTFTDLRGYFKPPFTKLLIIDYIDNQIKLCNKAYVYPKTAKGIRNI